MFQSALSSFKLQTMIWFPQRKLLILPLALGLLVMAPLARPQTVTLSHSDPFHQSLDLQAKANTDASIGQLFTEIHRRNLPGQAPATILDRMVRAQAGFINGTQAPVTEAEVANAVNVMGRVLDPETFTGTNERQVRLLRVAMLRFLPTLLAGGSPRPQNKMVANDFSPAGAVFVGLLLLHQKLANPAWFGDPDVQNKLWASARRTQQAPQGPQSHLRTESAVETNFRLMFQTGLGNENSSVTKAYHQFLDALSIGK